MTSVERMFQFTCLEQEGSFERNKDFIVEKNWPSRGVIEFKNVYLRYNKEGEPVLKNLTLKIESEMKVCTEISRKFYIDKIAHKFFFMQIGCCNNRNVVINKNRFFECRQG